ncbi:MAG TPA: hypothetical protein VJ729_09105 [Nitrososphaeraceae archaeon]|nr:hypothetical protein [Nitrososphaeraceae archaeon]
MEKQYHNKRIPRIYVVVKKQRVLILLNLILTMALSHFLLFGDAQSLSSGSHLSVYVTEPTGTTQACRLSERENLGCRATTSPAWVPFFRTQSLGDEQKLTCIQHVHLRCGAYSHDVSSIGGKKVYLSVSQLGNTVSQESQLDTAAPVSLTEISYSQHFILYTNPDKDFKIWYPSDWSINEENITHSGAIIESPDNTARIIVAARNVSPIESNMTTSELAKSVLSSSRNDSRSRFLELDSNNFYLSGQPAVKIVQIRNNETRLEDSADTQYKSMSLVTIVEGKAYFVSYIAQPETYAKNLEIAQTIIDSFEITNK